MADATDATVRAEFAPWSALVDWLRIAGAAFGAGAARVAAGTDRVDMICLLGLLAMTVGLALWFSLGVALTVSGAIALVVGLVGAARAERYAAFQAHRAGQRGD